MTKPTPAIKYRQEAVRNLLAILKSEQAAFDDTGMSKEYRDGYIMGFSDAIETLEDLNIAK